MTKSILFFVTLLGLCYEACGAMLKGSGKVLQPSQFKAEKSFLQNNNENSLLQLSGKGKGFSGKFQAPQSKNEKENAKIVLMTLLGDTEREEGKKSLQALKRMADRKMWNTREWLKKFGQKDKLWADKTSKRIMVAREREFAPPPQSDEEEISSVRLIDVIKEEKKNGKWSKLYDSGELTKYLEQLRIAYVKEKSASIPESFSGKFQAPQSKNEKENAKIVLMTLLGDTEREEGKKSLKALERMADRKMWNTEWWLREFGGMEELTAKKLSVNINNEQEKLAPLPPSNESLQLKQLIDVIKEEKKNGKWSKLYDSGEFTKYLEQLQKA